MLVHRRFRYRIYPTTEQVARLTAWGHSLRWLYNLAHQQRLMGLWRPAGEQKFPSAFDQIRELTELCAVAPWLADVPRNVCAQALTFLDKNWRACFKRQTRRPGFKKRRLASVSMTEPHPRLWKLTGTDLHFPKLGSMLAVVHRPLDGTRKTCTIKQDGDQWFATIVCEIEIADPAPSTLPPVALDRGVVNVVADSNGVLHEAPRPLTHMFPKIKRALRRVFHKRKGSNNRLKAWTKVTNLHRRARRQRDLFLHTLSLHYAKNHGKVIVEALDIRAMTENKEGYSKAILDSGWGDLVRMLEYKLIPLGGELVRVSAWYSSQTCAACGHVSRENRVSQSKFVCVACGHQAHADINAAKVLLSRGTHGGAVCGGSGAVGRPAKQKVRVARRGTRSGGSGEQPASS